MAEVKTAVSEETIAEPRGIAGDMAVTQERDVEIVEENVFDAVIQAAAKMDAYAKAYDAILNIIIKRSYPGDWVCHDREDVPVERRKANIGAAGAERFANFLGVREANWIEHPKEWSDDKKHYSYSFEADFSFQGITRHAIGRVGTRDKFFGFAHGAWKPLDEVDENDIRTAAFRDCVKKGITRLFGIRNIPLTKLRELGYDLAGIQFASFKEAAKTIKAEEAKAGEGGLVWKVIQVASMNKQEGINTTTKKPWVRFDVQDKEGIKYACFAAGDSKRVQVLSDHAEDQKPIKIGIKIVAYNGRQSYQIEQVEGAEA